MKNGMKLAAVSLCAAFGLTNSGCVAAIPVVAYGAYKAMNNSAQQRGGDTTVARFDAGGNKIAQKMGDPVGWYVIGQDGNLTDRPADPGPACNTVAADRTAPLVRETARAGITTAAGALLGGAISSFKGMASGAATNAVLGPDDPNLPTLCRTYNEWRLKGEAAKTVEQDAAEPALEKPADSQAPVKRERDSRHRSPRR